MFSPIKITKRGSIVRRNILTGEAWIEVIEPEDMQEITDLLNSLDIRFTTERAKTSGRAYTGMRYRTEVKMALYVKFNYDELERKMQERQPESLVGGLLDE